MPYSPFTKSLAAMLMLFVAWALLRGADFPGPPSWYVFLLPLLGGQVAKNAPMLSPGAFHRTLPPRERRVFWMMLRLPLAVVATATLSVAIVCWRHHFNWHAALGATTTLALPIIAIVGFSGLLTTLAMGRPERGWPLGLAAGGALAATCIMLKWNGYHRGVLSHWLGLSDMPGRYYYAGWQTLIVLGAVLCPVIWWQAAVRRRQWLAWGFLMVVATAGPWIAFFGRLGGYERPAPDSQGPVRTLTFASKPEVEPAAQPLPGPEIPMKDLLAVRGLQRGEALVQDRDVARPRSNDGMDTPLRFEAGVNAAGEAVWGQAATWETLAGKLPGHPPLRPWEEPRTMPSELSPLPPNLPDTIHGFVVTFGDPYVFDLAKGGSAGLPQGGLLQLKPPVLMGAEATIDLVLFSQGGGWADAPWVVDPHPDDLRCHPWLILVDERESQAYALESPYHYVDRLPLGQQRTWIYRALTLARQPAVEVLLRCRLYVFLPQVKFQVDAPCPRDFPGRK